MRFWSLFFALALLPLAPTFAANDHAEVLHGAVAIDTNPRGDLVVALDLASGDIQPDGKVDQLFVLQRADAAKIVTATLPEARVIFTGQRLIVLSLDSPQAWILHLPAPVSPEGHDPIGMKAHDLTHHKGYDSPVVLSGYGLSRHLGELPAEGFRLADFLAVPETHFLLPASPWRVDTDPFSKVDPFDDPSQCGSGSGSGCDAGGANATSCSVAGCSGSPSSCSVSCSRGGACCYCNDFNSASCTC